MKIQGLADPKDKPCGRVFQIEIQVFIMYPAECFITNDKRREVNQELRLLPKCAMTGYPQNPRRESAVEPGGGTSWSPATEPLSSLSPPA